MPQIASWTWQQCVSEFQIMSYNPSNGPFFSYNLDIWPRFSLSPSTACQTREKPPSFLNKITHLQKSTRRNIEHLGCSNLEHTSRWGRQATKRWRPRLVRAMRGPASDEESRSLPRRTAAGGPPPETLQKPPGRYSPRSLPRPLPHSLHPSLPAPYRTPSLGPCP